MLAKTFKKCFYPEFQNLTSNIITSDVYLKKRRPSRRVCIYTKRNRAVLSISRSSRHKLRLLIRSGLTYSIKKTSW